MPTVEVPLALPGSPGAASAVSAAAGFASHQAAAAAWNSYPHAGAYSAAAALATTAGAGATPEQAAEARRQMAAASDYADYTRLHYPPDGIYTQPPGESFSHY